MNWRRSSRCEAGACLLVAIEPDSVYLRNSRTGTILQITKAEWAAFRAGLEAGDFDEESHE